MFSIGFPGFYLRPNADLAVGFRSYNLTDPEEMLIKTPSAKLDVLNEAVKSYRSVSNVVFSHYYPFKESAFFLGAGFAHMTQNVGLEIDVDGEAQKLDYKNESLFAAGLIGWDWI